MRARFEAMALCKGFVRGDDFPNNGVDTANPLVKNTGGLKRVRDTQSAPRPALRRCAMEGSHSRKTCMSPSARRKDSAHA